MKNKPFMTVLNAKGERVELELVDTINLQNNKYVIVSQINSDDALAYRVVEKNGKKEYVSIGSGSEFHSVLEEYNKRNKH